MNKEQEYILCAAIWYEELLPELEEYLKMKAIQPFNISTGIVICGWRHGNCIAVTKATTGFRTVTYATDGVGEHTQGFLTSKNRFVNRFEGMEIAFKAGQVDERVALKDNPKRNDIYHKYKMLYSEDLY